ncbi:glycosyltransferase [Blattabacterium cuenoti]|nr:glycosyltransferase [Blattabacterium cuenoti]
MKKPILKLSNIPRILIGSGGTGGHIYPGIAIANELKKKFQKPIYCL